MQDSALKLAIRNVLHTTALLSALFASFFLLLWIHSYSHTAIFEWSGGMQSDPVGGHYSVLMVYSQHGGMGWQLRTYESTDRFEHDPAGFFGTNGTITSARASGYPSLTASLNLFHFSLWGFSIGHGERVPATDPHVKYTYSDIIIPHLALVALLSILPFIIFRHQWLTAQQAYRTTNTLCLTCGYDLRHSSERCPECGQRILPARASPQIAFGDEINFTDQWPRRAIGFLLSLLTVVAFSQLHFQRDHFNERMWQYFITRRQPEEVFLTFAGAWGVTIGNFVRSHNVYRLWNLAAVSLLVLAALLILSRATKVDPITLWIFLACCAVLGSLSWTTSKTEK